MNNVDVKIQTESFSEEVQKNALNETVIETTLRVFWNVCIFFHRKARTPSSGRRPHLKCETSGSCNRVAISASPVFCNTVYYTVYLYCINKYLIYERT